MLPARQVRAARAGGCGARAGEATAGGAAGAAGGGRVRVLLRRVSVTTVVKDHALYSWGARGGA